VRISGFVPKPFAPEQLAQAIAMARQGPGSWVGKERRQMPSPASRVRRDEARWCSADFHQAGGSAFGRQVCALFLLLLQAATALSQGAAENHPNI
jgi:hypothetical protein